MPPSQRHIVSEALSRLRYGVTLCCTVIGLAVAVQVVVWSLASFTDLRYVQLEDAEEGPLVVTSDDDRAERDAPLVIAAPVGRSAERAETPAVDPNRVKGVAEVRFALAAGWGRAAGTLAMLGLLPILLAGLVLAAGTATPGVDRVASAFMWSIMAAILLLPTGDLVPLPWQQGGLTSYEHMASWIDLAEHGDASTTVFFARFLILPLACLLCVVVIGLKFGAGVEASIVPKESNRLDPVLEQEAANIKPSSLIGGRSGASLKHALSEPAKHATAAPPGPSSSSSSSSTTTTTTTMPRATQVSPGTAPRRLI